MNPTNIDSGHILRGICDCGCLGYEYYPGNSMDCINCNHKPVRHQDLTNRRLSLPYMYNYPSSPSSQGDPFSPHQPFYPPHHPQAHYPQQGSQASGPTCKFPGCPKKVWEENGKQFDYCGRTHAQQAKQQQQQQQQPVVDPTKKCKHPNCSRTRDELIPSIYCGRSHLKSHLRTEPILDFLDSASSKYQELVLQFTAKWLHPTPKGKVVSILTIYPTTALCQKFDAYVQTIIQNRPNLKVFQHGAPANVHRRFHGTKHMACKLGLGGTSTLCSDPNCGTCGITRSGLLISRAQTHFHWGRFGKGLYLSSCSSKSNDYNQGTNTGLGGNHRAMFICKVVVGLAHKELQDNQTLTAPPNNCDSVLGEVGGTLNYDEVVVYNEGAVLPQYLIIYTV